MVHTQNVNVPLPNCFAWSSVPTDLAHISLQGRMNKSVDKRDQHGLGKPALLVKNHILHKSGGFASSLERENTGQFHKERCSLCKGLATNLRGKKSYKFRF